MSRPEHSHIIPVVTCSTCHKTLQLSQLVLASQTHSHTGQHNVLYDPPLYYATTDGHIHYTLFIYTRYLAGSGFTITWCRCLLLAFCEWLYSRDAMIGSDLGSDRNVDLGPLGGGNIERITWRTDFCTQRIHVFLWLCSEWTLHISYCFYKCKCSTKNTTNFICMLCTEKLTINK